MYLPSGWLLWVRAGTLVAQRLNLDKATLTGEPVTVADGAGAVSAAATGLVAYTGRGPAACGNRPVRRTRAGRTTRLSQARRFLLSLAIPARRA